MRAQTAAMLVGGIVTALASLPVAAQNMGAAAPIADDTPVDLLAVQSPCGEPDRYRGKKDRLYMERNDGSILLADAYRSQALGMARLTGELLAASCDRRFVAIANARQLHLLSTKNDRQPMIIPLPADATGAVFTKNNRQIWVGLSKRNEALNIDLHSGALRTISFPFAAARLAADFKENNLYILDQTAGGLHVVDERSGRLLSGKLPKFGIGADMMRSPTDNELWIVRTDRPQITILRTKPPFAVIKAIDLPSTARAIQFVRRGERNIALVSLTAANSVAAIDADKFSVIGNIDVHGSPASISASGDGAISFISLVDKSIVEVVDVDSLSVVGSINTGLPASKLIHIAGAGGR